MTRAKSCSEIVAAAGPAASRKARTQRDRRMRQEPSQLSCALRAAMPLSRLSSLADAIRQADFNSSEQLRVRPSKLPFDMISTRSPGLALRGEISAISSAEANALRVRPRLRSDSAMASGEGARRRQAAARDSRGRSRRHRRRQARPAERPERLCGAWCSSAARRRPRFCGRASACARLRCVRRIAVGWCAKSSTTRTPFASPLISMRRRTL